MGMTPFGQAQETINDQIWNQTQERGSIEALAKLVDQILKPLDYVYQESQAKNRSLLAWKLYSERIKTIDKVKYSIHYKAHQENMITANSPIQAYEVSTDESGFNQIKQLQDTSQLAILISRLQKRAEKRERASLLGGSH